MSKRKLLLADDSVTIQKVVNLTFADEGIEVIAVGDGDTALDRFFELSPDLVMADVNMPGLTGYQLCERIRQDGAKSQTPVILLVGSFEPFDEAEANRVGADDFLTKPFQSIRQLVNKVTVLLSSSEAETAKLPPPTPEGSSFDDTLRMEESEVAESIPKAEFADTGDDDEMIQSSPISSYSFDESQKFETKTEPEVDYSATQQLTSDEVKSFELVESTSFETEKTAVETIAENRFATEGTETASEPEEVQSEETAISETDESSKIEAEEEMPMPEVASVLELDETNPLELPPIEYDSDPGDVELETEEHLETPQLAPATQTANVAALEVPNAQAGELPSDLIELIIQKVMERLSDKAVKEIAWEVVPEVAERVVKKMAEENLKK